MLLPFQVLGDNDEEVTALLFKLKSHQGSFRPDLLLAYFVVGLGNSPSIRLNIVRQIIFFIRHKVVYGLVFDFVMNMLLLVFHRNCRVSE